MRRLLAAGIVALALAVPVAAWAGEWQDGHVYVGLSTGQYNVYDNGGIFQEQLDQGLAASGLREAVDCAFDRSGILLTTAFRFGKIVRFPGPHPHAKLLPDITTGSVPESITFARDGSFYVGHRDTDPTLRKFTSSGAPAGSFSPANAATLLDLAADQKTMFFTSRTIPAFQTTVHRFDVSTSTDLPDFADLGGDPATNRIADLKLLPPGDGSGGLIVARNSDIKRLNGQGAAVQTYDVAGEDAWFGIALDPDGQSFWAQSSNPGNVFRFNINSGAVDRGPLPAANGAFGICVKGTRTAALDNAAPSVTITTPANGATFTQGQVVNANYSCADDANGTGIAACSGPVANGAPIDTGSVGTKTFKVDARDVAGNTASRTNTYTVAAPAPPPPPPPPPTVIRVNVTFSTLSFARFTIFRDLVVRNVPRGSRVTAKCRLRGGRGRRCRRVSDFLVRSSRRSTIRLRPAIRKRIPVGARIEVRVTKPGNFTGAVKRVTIRRKKVPISTERCLPPGATRPVRC